jgi:hypothetical protein
MDNYSTQSWIDQPATYQIVIKGRLDANWTEWFDNLAITVTKDESGTVITTLTGPIMDQGVLHGLLARVRDLGLPLLEVRCLDTGGDSGPACGDNGK